MKLQNIFLLIIMTISIHPVQATIGNKVDAFVDKGYSYYEYLVLEIKFKTGAIPPLTRENIKKYPQHKDAYIAYAVAHSATLFSEDPLLIVELATEYPRAFARHASPALKHKLASFLKK